MSPKKNRAVVDDPFDVQTPFDATETQRETAKNVAAYNRGKSPVILAWIEACGRRGATPHEIASALVMNVVTVRAICTTLHQHALIRRTNLKRPTPSGNPAHVYMAQSHWLPSDGDVPSRAHRGRGQQVDPAAAPVLPSPPQAPNGNDDDLDWFT